MCSDSSLDVISAKVLLGGGADIGKIVTVGGEFHDEVLSMYTPKKSTVHFTGVLFKRQSFFHPHVYLFKCQLYIYMFKSSLALSMLRNTSVNAINLGTLATNSSFILICVYYRMCKSSRPHHMKARLFPSPGDT